MNQIDQLIIIMTMYYIPTQQEICKITIIRIQQSFISLELKVRLALVCANHDSNKAHNLWALQEPSLALLHVGHWIKPTRALKESIPHLVVSHMGHYYARPIVHTIKLLLSNQVSAMTTSTKVQKLSLVMTISICLHVWQGKR